MQTTITERGQISIPARLRKKYNLKAGRGIQWIEKENGIFLMPVPEDPIAAFRESGKEKPLTEVLLQERKKDKEKENRRWLK